MIRKWRQKKKTMCDKNDSIIMVEKDDKNDHSPLGIEKKDNDTQADLKLIA